MSLTLDDAKHMAKLAKLSSHDAENMLEDFNKILDLFGKIQAIDTERISNTPQQALSLDHCRQDEVTSPSLSDVLGACTHYSAQSLLIEVPKVIED